MLNCPILIIFGQLWGNSKKKLENYYRIFINRVFEHKSVQFTGLPFRNQEFAKNWPKKIQKKLDKSIKLWQSCQKKSSSHTRMFVNWVKLNIKKKLRKFSQPLAYKIKIIESLFLVARLCTVLSASFPSFIFSILRVAFFSKKSLSQNFALRFLRLLFTSYAVKYVVVFAVVCWVC